MIRNQNVVALLIGKQMLIDGQINQVMQTSTKLKSSVSSGMPQDIRRSEPREVRRSSLLASGSSSASKKLMQEYKKENSDKKLPSDGATHKEQESKADSVNRELKKTGINQRSLSVADSYDKKTSKEVRKRTSVTHKDISYNKNIGKQDNKKDSQKLPQKQTGSFSTDERLSNSKGKHTNTDRSPTNSDKDTDVRIKISPSLSTKAAPAMSNSRLKRVNTTRLYSLTSPETEREIRECANSPVPKEDTNGCTSFNRKEITALSYYTTIGNTSRESDSTLSSDLLGASTSEDDFDSTAEEETEERKFEEIFRDLDSDNDGALSFKELKEGAQLFGWNPTKSEIAQYLKDIDKNGDEKLSRKEFRVYCKDLISKLQHPTKSLRDSIEVMMNAIDIDGDGLCNKEEFKKFIQERGDSPLTDAEVDELFRHFDDDGDKTTLNKQELLQVLTTGMDDKMTL